MRVSEAKEKICPFMSGLGSGVSQSGDFLIDFEEIICRHGDCMAWVFTRTRIVFDDLSSEEKQQRLAPEKLHKELPEDEKEGYCTRLGKC